MPGKAGSPDWSSSSNHEGISAPDGADGKLGESVGQQVMGLRLGVGLAWHRPRRASKRASRHQRRHQAVQRGLRPHRPHRASTRAGLRLHQADYCQH
ncbi:MAG: hypothetical protein HC911_17580, partial [Chloroflexaceae bacterium]|nr:hypothetical protein [Chloroflexaceae bacterium]